jgi:hypothetical protein
VAGDLEHIIRVDGEIHLGNERILEDEPDERRASRSSFVNVVGSVLPPHESRALSLLPTKDVQRDEVRYTLRPAGRQLSIKDDGLVLTYGIFGTPGSGKTNLLMHLLNQVLAHKSASPEHKFGALILDPKAALIKGVKDIVSRTDRGDDLVVINPRSLAKKGVNLLDCAALKPTDLGKILVLAAKSAGVGGTEEFWFGEMAAVFGAILTLMDLMEPGRKPTLAGLMDYATGSRWPAAGSGPSNPGPKGPKLQLLIDLVPDEIAKNQRALKELEKCRLAYDRLRRYAISGDSRTRPTVEQFMEMGFSIFQEPENACYSAESPRETSSLYDQIINDGKIVLVSTGPQDLTLSRIVCSLMKLLFQRTVLGRFDRFDAWQLSAEDGGITAGITNDTRPVLFMADEYHMVATQVKDSPFGDTEYFSQARQQGGLCLVATQDVEGMKTSGLGEAWKAVFAKMAGIIFMQGGDPETREYAEKLAGQREYILREQGRSQGKGEESLDFKARAERRSALPDGALDTLERGDAIIMGTTEGTHVRRSIRYFHAPPWKDPTEKDQGDPHAES